MILHGDALETLRTLESDSVQCCVTSPPYWGLRSYLPGEHPDKGRELGLESTPEEHVAAMVAVFEEVRRVLRPDGVLWLNYGDCYAVCNGGGGNPPDSPHQKQATNAGSLMRTSRFGPGLKPKDLVGMPWRVAFALQAAGWWLRCDVIWHKPNPMPESVTDRPTKAHEYVFLLTKSARYYYDADAVREDGVEPGRARNERIGGANGHTVRHSIGGMMQASPTRNMRSVWTIPTQAFSEAHFATYPEELAARCILAGTSEYGACAACGTPWERVVERVYVGDNIDNRPDNPRNGIRGSGLARAPSNAGRHPRSTLGWQPACACGTEERCPCVVLDPFCGSGTTGLVALRYGRDFIGCELNAEYIEMAERRMAAAKAQPLLLTL